jgi:hypothetical protein
MICQVVRLERVNGKIERKSVGIARYQRAIMWCADANLHCEEFGLPYEFEMYRLAGPEIELETTEVI